MALGDGLIPGRPTIALDGTWELIADPEARLRADSLPEGRPIRVPGCWEATVEPDQAIVTAWYRRRFEVSDQWIGRRAVIRFGAVSYRCDAWLNGVPIGSHEGAYTPFSFDAGSALNTGTSNDLIVRVVSPGNAIRAFPAFSTDRLDAAEARVPELPVRELPLGKQTWYASLSGIWQSVRMELLADLSIEWLGVNADPASGLATVAWTIGPVGAEPGLLALDLGITDEEGTTAATATVEVIGAPRGEAVLRVEAREAWAPGSAHLYTLRAALRRGADLVDTRDVRFGFRSVEARDGRVLINGSPTMIRGVLDQDLYDESVWVAPSAAALRRRLETVLAMGFNLVRCHMKVPDPAYLDLADELGLLVWCELPSWLESTAASRTRAHEQLVQIVAAVGHHPSVVIWTIANEGWGLRLGSSVEDRRWLRDTVRWLKAVDPTRLVVDNSPAGPPSGDFHVASDLADTHAYFALPGRRADMRAFVAQLASRPSWLWSPHGDAESAGDEPLLLSEFGNWGLPVLELPSHGAERSRWWTATGDGPTRAEGIEERFQRFGLNQIWPDLASLSVATQWQQFEALQAQVGAVRGNASIAGFVVTELTDAAWEPNGLLDVGQRSKAFNDQLVDLFGATAVFADLERHDLTGGDTLRAELVVVSDGGTPAESKVAWTLLGDSFEVNGSIAVLGRTALAISVPAVARLVDARLELRVESTNAAVAAQQAYRVRIFPEPAERHPGTGPRRLVTTTLDAEAVQFARDGGEVLAILESGSLSESVAAELGRPLRVHARRASDDGQFPDPNWVSAFDWLAPGVIPGLTEPVLLDAAFEKVVPTQVLRGIPEEAYAAEVIGGSFSGWLGAPSATVWSAPIGRGRVTITTLRLASADGPAAASLLAGLGSVESSGGPDEPRIPARARLRRPALGREVDVHESEPRSVAERPLEVVEQRPNEVAAHVDTGVNRLPDAGEVLAQVVDPAPVVDRPVRPHVVTKADAVLRHEDRHARIVGVQPEKLFEQRIGIDAPAHLRDARRRGRRGRNLRPTEPGACRADGPPEVVVQAEEVDRPRDRGEVAGTHHLADVGAVASEQLGDVAGIRAAQQRLEEPAVRGAVRERCRVPVLVAVGGRARNLQVERQPDLAAEAERAIGLDRQAVPEQEVMRRPDRRAEVTDAGRMDALVVAQERLDPRLVQRQPPRDPVAEPPEHGIREVRESLGRLATRPATDAILEGLWQVPVVEIDDRRDPARQETVDEPRVEVEARRVEPAAAFGLDPRPRDGEAVRSQPDLGHEVEVAGPAVVVVAGDVAGSAPLDGSGRVAEAIPDRLAAAIDVDRALDLVRRGRRAPQEAWSHRRDGSHHPGDGWRWS